MVAVFYKNADYVTSLGRFVASRYADGLFPRVYRAEDGTAYNVSGNSLMGQALWSLLRPGVARVEGVTAPSDAGA